MVVKHYYSGITKELNAAAKTKCEEFANGTGVSHTFVSPGGVEGPTLLTIDTYVRHTQPVSRHSGNNTP